MVQFVKAIVEESSLKGFDVLWADAQERKCTVHTITQLAELGLY